MRSIHTRFVGLAIAVLAFAAPARGLELVSDDRSVHSVYQNDITDPIVDQTFVPPVPFGAFDPGLGQHSSSIELTPDGLGFDGTAQGASSQYYNFPSFGRVDSVFAIEFRLDRVGSIELEGTLSGGAGGLSNLTLLRDGDVVYDQEVGPYIYDPSGSGCEFQPPFTRCSVSISFFGALEPGLYTLEASPEAGTPGAYPSFDFSFHVLQEVPEPATAMSLAIGLAWISARRRGRARH